MPREGPIGQHGDPTAAADADSAKAAIASQKTPVRVYETPFIADVRLIVEAAQKLLNHPDLRTQITAKSILRK